MPNGERLHFCQVLQSTQEVTRPVITLLETEFKMTYVGADCRCAIDELRQLLSGSAIDNFSRCKKVLPAWMKK